MPHARQLDAIDTRRIRSQRLVKRSRALRGRNPARDSQADGVPMVPAPLLFQVGGASSSPHRTPESCLRKSRGLGQSPSTYHPPTDSAEEPCFAGTGSTGRLRSPRQVCDLERSASLSSVVGATSRRGRSRVPVRPRDRSSRPHAPRSRILLSVRDRRASTGQKHPDSCAHFGSRMIPANGDSPIVIVRAQTRH